MIVAGQLMGWLAAALTFLSYQCKEHKKLLVVQTLSTVSICISYLLLQAWSGMALNVVCLLRNFIIYKRDLKIFSYRFWPYVLAVVMGIAGAASWQGILSILVVAALVINTLFLCSENVQTLRKSILVTSAMVLAYNACFTVWGGVANEMLAISSAIIGICRYKNPKPRS